MIKCTVEMWGLPRELSGLPQVEVRVKDDAGLRDVIAALKIEVPALEGAVISSVGDRLEDTCAFAIGGQFYADGEDVKLHEGDRLRLLTLATGG